MKPKLIVVKKKKLKNDRIVTETHFVIVDLDNPQGYH